MPRTGLVLFLALVLIVMCIVLSYWPGGLQSELPVRQNISSGFIIALEPHTVYALQEQVHTLLGVGDTSILQAVNGTQALGLAGDGLPVYMKNLLRWGRHDHMQLYSGGSLGCLLSHMQVWRQVKGVALVLEEDAVLDATSLKRFDRLMVDMKNLSWDLLMLEGGHVGLTGVWRYVGRSAATCADWTTVDSGASCNWMGSRGYLITERGAKMLLKNAHPYMVQTDALMGLTATFDPTFLMYWTVMDIARPTYLRGSRLWDGCIKCYAPLRGIWYLVLALVFMMLGALCSFWGVWKWGGRRLAV